MGANITASVRTSWASWNPRWGRFALRMAKGALGWELLMGIVALTILVGGLPFVIAILLHVPLAGFAGIPVAFYLFAYARKLPMELIHEAIAGV